MEKLQQRVVSLESEVELLHSQLYATRQEKVSCDEEATKLQKKLLDARNKVWTEEKGLRYSTHSLEVLEN